MKEVAKPQRRVAEHFYNDSSDDGDDLFIRSPSGRWEPYQTKRHAKNSLSTQQDDNKENEEGQLSANAVNDDEDHEREVTRSNVDGASKKGRETAVPATVDARKGVLDTRIATTKPEAAIHPDVGRLRREFGNESHTVYASPVSMSTASPDLESTTLHTHTSELQNTREKGTQKPSRTAPIEARSPPTIIPPSPLPPQHSIHQSPAPDTIADDPIVKAMLSLFSKHLSTLQTLTTTLTAAIRAAKDEIIKLPPRGSKPKRDTLIWYIRGFEGVVKMISRHFCDTLITAEALRDSVEEGSWNQWAELDSLLDEYRDYFVDARRGWRRELERSLEEVFGEEIWRTRNEEEDLGVFVMSRVRGVRTN